MATLKAPYNFVPVDKEVVIPHWGKHISHDIPFEDGLSGTINLIVEAHSPIFVRDGATKPKSENDPRPNWFSQFNDRPFIPGSSLKGMIRNVMEIMTFSKMKGRVNDGRFSFRDFYNSDLYDLRNFGKNVHGGWLFKNSKGEYLLEDCGKPGRISLKEIAQAYGLESFLESFLDPSEGGSYDANNDEHKSAKFKYDRFENNSKTATFIKIPKKADSKDNRVKFRIENILSESDLENKTHFDGKVGTLVFTGQPNSRKESITPPSGKIFEFIFWTPKNSPIPIDSEVITDFKCAYLDNQKLDDQSIDWKFWKSKLEAGEKIPVFFLPAADKNKKIERMGLSMLFKFAYKHSVKDAIPQKIKETQVDFADAIFGYILNENDEEREESLKGRIHFGHAFAKPGFQVEGEPKHEVLASPKASYYPNYMRQEVKNNGKVKGNYQTFMNDEAVIAGWKRYPVHLTGVKPNPKPENASDKILTEFIPLKEGVVFEGKIRFHNLKRVELGALLSALTFHNTNSAYHSLGMAKPLGYGKVKLTLSGIEVPKTCVEAEAPEIYMKEFEAYMNICLRKNEPWHETEQICELLSMACEQKNHRCSELSYMQLEEFRDAKKEQLALGRYSKLDGIRRVCATSLLQEGDIAAMQSQLEKEEQLYQQKVSPKEIVSRYREEQKKRFQEKLEGFKQAQIEALRNRRELIRKQEKQEKSERKMEQARSGAPEWEEIDFSYRDAFEYLKKAVQQYVEDYHGSKYKNLTEEMGGGVLPEEHRQALIEKVLLIVRQASKNERKRWMKPIDKNAYLKKIREWIGREEVEELEKNMKTN